MGIRAKGALMGRRRPLVGVFILFAVGTWCGLRLPDYAILVFAALAVAATPLLVRRRPRSAWLLPLVVLACASATLRSPPGPTPMFPDAGSGQRVLGIVSADPEKTSGTREGGASWTLELGDARWRMAGGRWMPFVGVLRVRWRGPGTVMPARYGDLVEISGRYAPPSENSRASWNGILYTGYDNTDVIAGGHGSDLKSWCYDQRRKARRYLHAGLDEQGKITTVLDALLLGYRRRMGFHLKEQFARTGMIHLFAISGLHVGILALLLASLLRRAGVPKTHWGLVMVPVLVFYVLATGAKPSAVRACLMASIYVMAPWFKREPDALSALAAAAIVILLVTPGDLLNIGFVLSFSVVTGLILLYPVVWALGRAAVRAWLSRPSARERERDADFIPGGDSALAPGRAPAWVSGPCHYVASLSVLTVCAWLVSTPLTAYYFGRFSPVSLVANVFAIPLTFVIVLLGCLSILLGSAWVPLAVIANRLNALVVWLLLSLARVADSVPGGCVTVKAFPAWAVWAWVAVLFAMVAVTKRLLPSESRYGAVPTRGGEAGDHT